MRIEPRGFIDSIRVEDFDFEVRLGTDHTTDISIDHPLVIIASRHRSRSPEPENPNPLCIRRIPFCSGYGPEMRSLVEEFAHRFATDPAYRADCESGSTRWARLERWYSTNRAAYHNAALGILLSDTDAPIQTQLRELHDLIDQNLEYLEASYTYARHLAADDASPEPSGRELDPGVAGAVAGLNAIEGVRTCYSCEGKRRGIEAPGAGWPHGPIWFPGKHHPQAHVSFDRLTESAAEFLSERLWPAGVLCSRPDLRPHDHATQIWAASAAVEYNEDFIAELEHAARGLLEHGRRSALAAGLCTGARLRNRLRELLPINRRPTPRQTPADNAIVAADTHGPRSTAAPKEPNR